jgi:hypothetical protein
MVAACGEGRLIFISAECLSSPSPVARTCETENKTLRAQYEALTFQFSGILQTLTAELNHTKEQLRTQMQQSSRDRVDAGVLLNQIRELKQDNATLIRQITGLGATPSVDRPSTFVM